MIGEYNDWRTCDLCGHEGFCRPATTEEICQYEAEDVCQRCDGEDLRDNIIKELENVLRKVRDAGQWFHSALEMEYDVDGEQLLKEIEALVGTKE